MGLLDRLRRRFAPPGPDVSVAEAVVARYGTERTERLRNLVLQDGHTDVSLVQVGPFAWAEGRGAGAAMVRYVPHAATDVIRLTGLDELAELLEDARADLTVCSKDLVFALRKLGVQVFEHLYEATLMQDPSVVLVKATPRLRDEFEPPHFEGRRFVFLTSHTPPGAEERVVERVGVDADTLAVTREVLGSGGRLLPAQRLVVKGRAYVRDDGALVAASLDAHDRARSEDAGRWREQARMEHASVASFARAALELMAAGAPLDLVRRIHEAALDEVRHAEQCLAVAERLDGQRVVLGPLPALAPRPGTLEEIAMRTLSEAAIPETEAAAQAAVDAEREPDPFTRDVLRAQAADEHRHAALAWDIVRWASPSLASSGSAVSPPPASSEPSAPAPTSRSPRVG